MWHDFFLVDNLLTKSTKLRPKKESFCTSINSLLLSWPLHRRGDVCSSKLWRNEEWYYKDWWKTSSFFSNWVQLTYPFFTISKNTMTIFCDFLPVFFSPGYPLTAQWQSPGACDFDLWWVTEHLRLLWQTKKNKAPVCASCQAPSASCSTGRHGN